MMLFFVVVKCMFGLLGILGGLIVMFFMFMCDFNILCLFLILF